MIASLHRRICLTRFIFSGSAKTDGQLAGSGQEATVLKTFNQLLDWLRHGGGARTKAIYYSVERLYCRKPARSTRSAHQYRKSIRTMP